MTETVQGLIDVVKNEASFDVSDSTALGWLNRAHKKMVSRSRCLRYTASLGTTVVDQRDYALPAGIVESYEVLVDGVSFGKAKHTDLAFLNQNYLVYDGEGGVMAPEETAVGALEIALFPTPTDSGLEITIRAAWLPPDLSTGDNSTIKIPDDFIDALIAGAVAVGLNRVEHRPDLADRHMAEFNEGTQELRRQVNRRYRGSGPAQIRVILPYRGYGW